MTEILEVPTEPVKTAQTEAPSTEPTTWMALDDDFRNNAPDAVKDLITKKGYTSLGQFFDSYTELEKFKGIGEHLVIPEAEDAEGWENVYKQLGRPETHDKYDFEEDPDVPFGEEILDRFKQGAYKEGFTQRQAAWVLGLQRDIIKEVKKAEDLQNAADTEADETRKEEIRSAYKQKWGGEVAFQNKIKDARVLADKLGIYQTLEAKGLTSDPEIINMLDIISLRTAEDVIAPQTPTTPQLTPIQERKEIMESEAFTSKFHKEHKNTMKRYMELNQVIANAGVENQPRL